MVDGVNKQREEILTREPTRKWKVSTSLFIGVRVDVWQDLVFSVRKVQNIKQYM